MNPSRKAGLTGLLLAVVTILASNQALGEQLAHLVAGHPVISTIVGVGATVLTGLTERIQGGASKQTP